ncbi:MAG: HEAT repeat domain-containing protein [Bdellovibrionales bacterium]|nr:HEAT repeat domain-containing protein [Bdellovibrionales bacterium]
MASSTGTRFFLFALILWLNFIPSAQARRRHSRRLRIPTHPIYLWAKTLAESKDDDQRKIAAFKLSQYSQPIFQEPVIDALLSCVSDDNLHIKVLCTKALGRARKRSKSTLVRNALVKQYKAEPFLRNTVVRTFIALNADEPHIQKMLMAEMQQNKKPGELIVLMSYFEKFGSGDDAFVKDLSKIYHENTDPRVRVSVAKAISERADGQKEVIELLAECTGSSDTPLVLTCLTGLQAQGTKNPLTWSAVERTILSRDPDVLETTLDVIDALPESPNPKVSARLLQIITDADDSELREKAVLSLGVCGNKSSDVVDLLQRLVEEESVGEDIRIAAALVLGKQAEAFPVAPRRILDNCGTKEKSQNLRTACQLGLQELKTRTAPPKKGEGNSSAPFIQPRESLVATQSHRRCRSSLGS